MLPHSGPASLIQPVPQAKLWVMAVDAQGQLPPAALSLRLGGAPLSFVPMAAARPGAAARKPCLLP